MAVEPIIANSIDFPNIEAPSFSRTLAEQGLELRRANTNVLQINVGLKCNLACRHCHLDAGPGRDELMDRAVMDQVIHFASKVKPDVIDITGGAPEMNPDLTYLIRQIAAFTPRLMLRTNLTAISDIFREELSSVLKDKRVVIVASFPSTNARQTDAQRGQGVYDKSLAVLKQLNDMGYGIQGSGLELNLISNPSGAFLPVSQIQAEKNFKRVLAQKMGLHFSNLYTFANVPLGRFYQWLKKSGNLNTYLEKLAKAFNPCTIDRLMCRNLLSVSWDGFVFDCDFNQAGRLYLGGEKQHITTLDTWPDAGLPIRTADHCFACTAGAGFT